MQSFEKADTESLEGKLLALELTQQERSALDMLIACAEQAASDVSGFAGPVGLKLGGLSFLSELGTTVRPEDAIFASAGGLGTTRQVAEGYLGGALGDEQKA